MIDGRLRIEAEFLPYEYLDVLSVVMFELETSDRRLKIKLAPASAINFDPHFNFCIWYDNQPG